MQLLDFGTTAVGGGGGGAARQHQRLGTVGTGDEADFQPNY